MTVACRGALMTVACRGALMARLRLRLGGAAAAAMVVRPVSSADVHALAKQLGFILVPSLHTTVLLLTDGRDLERTASGLSSLGSFM